MKNLLIALLFMAIVIGFMPVGFAANVYESIDEIELDGEEAIGETTTLELEYSSIIGDYYSFSGSDHKTIFFEKDDKFKNIIKSIIRAKAQSDYNHDYRDKYFITFEIVGFKSGYVIGKIIKINDSANEPMK